jgi:hypothetical protein
MFFTIRRSAAVALCSAGLALLLSADHAWAQRGSCQGLTNGQTGSQQTGQLTPAQLQTLIQQLQTAQGSPLTSSQLQMLLQQLQTGTTGGQSTTQLTPAQLQGLTQQLQFGTSGVVQNGQLTPFQLRMLLLQQNALATPTSAPGLRGGR